MRVSFTYEVITPESAGYGEAAEHGWIMPGHWEYPLQDDDGYHREVIDQAQRGDFDITDLSEAVSFAQSLGICCDTGGWLESIDPDRDYTTGAETRYAMHIEGVTPSTANRIARLVIGGA